MKWKIPLLTVALAGAVALALTNCDLIVPTSATEAATTVAETTTATEDELTTDELTTTDDEETTTDDDTTDGLIITDETETPDETTAPPFDGEPPEGGRPGGMSPYQSLDLAAAAEKLGISEEELSEALGIPQSMDLAEIAAELGISEETLAEVLEMFGGGFPQGGDHQPPATQE